MYIRVKLYDTLRRLSNTPDRGIWEGDLPENCSIIDLIEQIGTREGEVACAAINKQVVPLDTILQAGDEVVLVTNISGG